MSREQVRAVEPWKRRELQLGAGLGLDLLRNTRTGQTQWVREGSNKTFCFQRAKSSRTLG